MYYPAHGILHMFSTSQPYIITCILRCAHLIETLLFGLSFDSPTLKVFNCFHSDLCTFEPLYSTMATVRDTPESVALWGPNRQPRDPGVPGFDFSISDYVYDGSAAVVAVSPEHIVVRPYTFKSRAPVLMTVTHRTKIDGMLMTGLPLDELFRPDDLIYGDLTHGERVLWIRAHSHYHHGQSIVAPW